MNKLLTLFLVLLTTASFAQKGKVFQAASALSTGDLLEAKKLIDQAVKDESVQDFAKAWMTKGEVYVQIQQTGLEKELNVVNGLEQAEEAYRKAYTVDMASEKKPGKNKNEIKLGLLNVAIGYYERGAAQFDGKAFDAGAISFIKAGELVTYLDNNDLLSEDKKVDAYEVRTNGYQNAALCALNSKDYPKAMECYVTLIDMGEGTEQSYANLSTLYITENKYEEAKKYIDEGLNKFPESQSLNESLLNYYIGTDQSEKAIGSLEKAIAANPTNPDLYFNLALAYDKLDQDEDMIGAYEKIMSIDPNYYAAYLNLGAFYNEKANEVIKAMNELTDYKAANAMLPQRDEWYNKALPYLEKAYQLQPEDPAVKGALSRIYANMNMLDKVKELQD